MSQLILAEVFVTVRHYLSPCLSVPVTLAANSGFFKGFLIQARVTDPGPSRGNAVGTFTPIDGTKQICDFVRTISYVIIP